MKGLVYVLLLVISFSTSVFMAIPKPYSVGNPAGILSYRQASMSVPQLNNTIDWYALIGFQVQYYQEYPQFGTANAIVNLTTDSNVTLYLELLYQNNSVPGANRPAPPEQAHIHGISQFSFLISDIQQAKSYLNTNDIPILYNSSDSTLGWNSLFIEDLNGNIIELIESINSSSLSMDQPKRGVAANPLGIISFSHVAISVSSLDQATGWYAAFLGLKLLVEEQPNSYNTSLAIVGWNDQDTFALPLELLYQSNAISGPKLPVPPGQSLYQEITQFSFLVANLTQTMAYFSKTGVQALFGFVNNELHLEGNFIRDLDGNLIEFIQEL